VIVHTVPLSVPDHVTVPPEYGVVLARSRFVSEGSLSLSARTAKALLTPASARWNAFCPESL
jgi:hypothetical protein